MKKLVFLAFCTIAISFASCGNKQADAELGANDTTLVDTMAVDTLVTDSVVAE